MHFLSAKMLLDSGGGGGGIECWIRRENDGHSKLSDVYNIFGILPMNITKNALILVAQ